ncbi:MAG: hypothetical protein JNN04_12785 [Cyclobacteriaceae bacterium]|nr:hypothetical protein [Cyclobacteriaceae bacterium]
MKALIFSALVSLAVPATAKIWIVDSNPGSTAKDFVSLNAAYAGAAAGDTLYLIGSPNNYLTTNLAIAKRLIIIGPGYFLNENPNTQANIVPAIVSHVACVEAIQFAPGSEGTVLMGVQVDGLIVVNANNISLRRNRINPLAGGCTQESVIINGSNCLIQQNFIAGPQGRGIKVNAGYSNVMILNNFVQYFCYSCGNPGITAIAVTGSATEISNNVLAGALTASNSLIQNNIFIFGSTVSITTSIVRNNIHPSNGLPGSDGNLNNVPPSTVFVSASASTDGWYALSATSPAIGAGFGGSDCGMFGGTEPYVLSGIPPIPTIYSLIAPSIGEKNTGLPIQIKVKSNN